MSTEADDKDAIRELLAEYCFRLDGNHFAEMAALFTEDGTWETAFGSATGHAEIVALVKDIRAKAPKPHHRGIHMVANVSIKLDSTRAHVRSNWTVVQNGLHGPTIASGGSYTDDVIRLDGVWLFRHRKIDRFIKP